MAKFRSIKNSLIAGEVSPTAMGRTDLPQYLHACKTLQNMIPLLSGGAYRRPGSLYSTSLLEADYNPPALIPFVSSQTESYAILLSFNPTLGTPYMRAIRPTNVTGGGTVSTITGVGDLESNEVHEIQYAQSVDVMTIVHPSRKPKRLTRSAIDTFVMTQFDDGQTSNSWPFRARNSTAITMEINVAAVGVGRTLTASAAFFDALHVGARFKVLNGATYGHALVTGFTDSTHVTVTVIDAFGAAATPVATWWESAWSDYRGWPRSVGFYKGRMIYGGNATERDSLWCSQYGNYNVMSVNAIILPETEPTGTQPFTITLSSQQLNLIQWISTDKTLVVGTLGQEFILEQIDTSAGFNCGNVISTSQSDYGSAYHMPLRIGEELIFVAQADDEVKSLIFNDTQKTYVAEPVQLFFDHYPKPDYISGLRSYRTICWDRSRQTAWCVDAVGNLFGMTRNRRVGVTAWHTHKMGGYDATVYGSDLFVGTVSNYFLPTGGVTSVCVLPNPTIRVNDVWICVKRKIDGVWQYYVEKFSGKGHQPDTAYRTDAYTDGSFGADCSSLDDATLTHLCGETVVGQGRSPYGVFAFAAQVADATTGAITAPAPNSTFASDGNYAYGLPFSSIVEPVRLEAGSQIGTAQGAIKRIHKLTMRFFKTLSGKFGPDASNLETLIFRNGDTPMGSSPELFTGDKVMDFDGDYDRDGYVYLLQDKPLPFAVMSIIAEGQTSD